jgi:WD40 repeat protein
MDKLCLWNQLLDDYVMATAWSNDGNMVFSGTSAGSLYGFNAFSGEQVFHHHAHKHSLTSLDTSSTALRLATCGQDGVVNLYNSLDGKLLVSKKLGNIWLEFLRFSPNGKNFIVAGGKTVALFDLDGNLLWRYDKHTHTIAAIDWSAHSHHFITLNYGIVLFFNLKTPEPYETLTYPTSLISTKWSANGKYIASGTQDLKIHFWELPYEPNTDLEMSGYPSKVRHISWSADSTYLATNCDNQIVIWNVSGKGPAGTKPLQMKRHVGKVTQLVYQKNENKLLSGAEDGLVVLWQPSRNTNPLYVGTTEAEVSYLSWSPDETKAIIGTLEGHLQVWDFSNYQ